MTETPENGAAPTKRQKRQPKPISAASAKKARARTGRQTTAELSAAKRTKRPKKNKYNAKGRYIDDMFFASKAEGDRYEQLKQLQADGFIENLVCQPSYRCTVNNALICVYRADFRYDVIDDRGNSLRVVVEDVKGMITPVYRIKKKLVQACHNFTILEIAGKDVPKWENRFG